MKEFARKIEFWPGRKLPASRKLSFGIGRLRIRSSRTSR